MNKNKEKIVKAMEKLIQGHRDFFAEYRDARFPPSEHAKALKAESQKRDVYEVSNQLGGYIGPQTPDDLVEFLARESDEAAKLAEEIIYLRSALAEAEFRAEKAEAKFRASVASWGKFETLLKITEARNEFLEDYTEKLLVGLEKVSDLAENIRKEYDRGYDTINYEAVQVAANIRDVVNNLISEGKNDE